MLEDLLNELLLLLFWYSTLCYLGDYLSEGDPVIESEVQESPGDSLYLLT